MSQSSFIFGMLFLAFLVYITAKGELPTYIALLTGRKGLGGTGGITAKQQIGPQTAPGGPSTTGAPGGQENYDPFGTQRTPPGVPFGLPINPWGSTT
jgi:hypothetical protein